MPSQTKRKIITKFMAAMSVVAAFFFVSTSSAAESKTTTETIKDFYIRYLNYDHHKTPKLKRPAITLSKSFSEAVKKNEEICAAYSSEICGWGAEGDKYLDAQETGPNLNYKTSGIKFTEIRPNVVQVRLNVYPSDKSANGYYDKTITYEMVKESGNWVVDDIRYSDGESTRKAIADENAYTIANPTKSRNR
jgi:hypothetical protein